LVVLWHWWSKGIPKSLGSPRDILRVQRSLSHVAGRKVARANNSCPSVLRVNSIFAFIWYWLMRTEKL
jgi:hypothetical protein